MPDANDHARTILAAIIPGRTDLLDQAGQHLTEAHFQDSTLRVLFTLLQRYVDVTGAVITRSALSDLLRNQADAGRVLLYEETFDALAAQRVDDGEFKHSINMIRELAAEAATGEALTQGMAILRTGASDDRGKQIKGHMDARNYVMERFSDIDRELSKQASPEGDMRTENADMLEDYTARKAAHLSGKSKGVMFGIADLDLKIGGLQNGELVLIAGYSSDGKTSMCVQLAWDCAVMQGLNVAFLTTETLRPQVRRKILARHSLLPQFGLPAGLNTRDLKNGTLSTEDEDKLRTQVVPDFTNNPSYGRCYIVQVPRNATISTCESRLYRLQRKFHIDLVVIDYLRLLRSDRKRQSDREELGAIIVEAKQLATTFNDGIGVPIVSPWQVNRTARDAAERAGFYTSAALAETAETTNSSDVIVSLLAPSDNESRYCEVKGQILKNRDGEKSNSITMKVDYATSAFSATGTSEGMAALIGEDDPAGAGGEDFSALLGV